MIKPKGHLRRPFSDNKHMIEIACRTIQATELAVLIDAGLDSPVWLPKSQIEGWPDKGHHGFVLMGDGYAKKKGLI